MRAIDADALKNSVLKWLPPDPCGQEEKEYPFETDICVSLLMEIEEAPTIEPRMKGKWIDDTYCSECGWVHKVESGFIGSVKDFNYCPNCGADMRGEEK